MFSLKSQLPALDGEMVTDSNYLWSHQLVALFPQAGRFYMSGVGWLAPGRAEESCSQGRAGYPVAHVSLCLSGISLFTVRPPKAEKLLFPLNKSSSSQIQPWLWVWRFLRWQRGQLNTRVLSTFDLITFVPGTGVCWPVWGCFHQSSRI